MEFDFADWCDELVAEARDIVEPCEMADLHLFAARLSGLDELTLGEMRHTLADLTVPGDFRHLRLWNLTMDREWGGLYCTQQSKLPVEDIIRTVWCSLWHRDVTPTGRGVWTETVALPIKDPGTLELGLRFRSLH